MPPPAIYSKDGKPLLSWRVAVLPYIEQGPLYNQFKLDEPWDSAHNKKLLALMPKLYEPVRRSFGMADDVKRNFAAVADGEDVGVLRRL